MDDDSKIKRSQRGIVRSRGARGAHVNPPLNNSVVRHSNRSRMSASSNAQSQTSLPHIGYKMLCDMLSKNPDEMIIDMTKEYFQLDKYLSDKRMETNIEWLEILTTLFERMLNCLGQERRISEILMKLPGSVYFEALHEQLRSKDPKTGAFRLKLIHQTLKILDKMLTFSPHSESEVSPFIERIGTCLNRTRDEDDEIKQIKQLHSKIFEKADSIYQRNEEEKKIEQQKPTIDRRPPPNDFRLLNIIPSMNEILSSEPVFLRKNIIEQGGSYENAQHYLDVHFRLLREDFLGPLRDGIQSYIHKTTTKNTDIRIYENVFSLGPKLNPKNGLVYGLKLDEKKFGKIQWANSRRLIYGSLLALTSNQFQTCVFVTVEDRSELEKKLTLYVRPYFQTSETFTNHDSAKLQLLNQQQYLTMVETTSYFEAYRHILNALQKIPGDKFPFDSYILHLSSNITPPDYVKSKTQFDFTSLFVPLKAKIQTTTQLFHTANSTDLTNQRPQLSINYEIPSAMKRQYRNVTLLNENEWPKPNEVPLNERQYEALKLALTKKIALIQGPPGTGKTYLGVKIAELLLHNRSVWCTSTEENSPILMVCQTNHALDQFLEHIITRLKMNDGLIRVGGRCQNETIQAFSLTKARQNYREKHLIPSIIHKQKREIINRKNLSQLTIQSNETLIDASYLYLTSLSRLNDNKIIKFEHYCSLINTQYDFKKSQEKILADWLGLNDNIEFVESIEDEFEEMSIIENRDIQSEDDEEQEEENRRRDEIDSDNEFYQPTKTSKVKHSSLKNQSNDEWKTVVNKSKQKQIIQELLTRPPRLTDATVDKLETNLWKLSYEKRHDLYRYWLKKYRDSGYKSVSDAQFEFNRAMAEHLDYLKLEDYFILKNAIIIAMTTTCAAKYFDVLQKLGCKIVIVEEAAEIFEAHIITSLSPKCEHLILIGDHIQLRPSPSVYKLAQQYHMDVSLFERLVKNNFSNVRLNIQHRMRPELCRLMIHFYNDLKNHESVYTERPSIIGVRQNLYFINHNHPEELFAEGNSKQNRFEAEYILALAHFLVKQGYSTSKITILVMYLGQRALISRLLKASPFQKLLKSIRITVTDSYQGEENDIILLSLVRSNNPDNKIGFLKVHNRICVALSRARCAMFIIGNLKFLQDNEVMWEKMGKILTDGNAVGKGLPLCCNQHPEDIFIADTVKSFSERPEGGCKKLCGQRLRCGHSCSKLCHNYDHERVRCTKSCDEILYSCGHRCQNICHIDEPNNHGICKQLVLKQVPRCQHTINIACGIEPTSDKCTQMIPVRLPCDHIDNATCAIRTKNLIHTISCLQSCNRNLLCKHKCSGKCGECKAGQLHLPCKQKINRQLLCTHPYETICSDNYSLCSFPCETSCSHSKCSTTCSVPCSPCKEMCDNKCMHSQCSKLCSEICDRQPCRFPCSKQNTKCGHPCIGVCGEPCPIQCRICNKQIVEEYFFGTEDKPQACFVQLPDCGHLFEIDGLDRFVNESIAKSKNDFQPIQYISCPRCQTKIRHCQRYKSQINRIQLWIEEIKIQQQNGLKSSELTLERNQSIEQLKNLSKTSQSIEQKSFNEFIHRFDKKKKSINIDELNYLKNTCTFFKEIDRLLTIGQNHINNDSISSSFQHLIVYLLKQSNDKLTRNYTQQQLFDIQNELQRLRCLLNYFLLQAKSPYIQQTLFNNHLDELKLLVTKSGAFVEQDYQSFQRILTTIKENKYLLSLNLLEEQPISVVNTIKMESGQWYVCPNNHVYNIKSDLYYGKCPTCVPSRNFNLFFNNFN